VIEEEAENNYFRKETSGWTISSIVIRKEGTGEASAWREDHDPQGSGGKEASSWTGDGRGCALPPGE
jgi:hypothetical protein